MDKYLLLAALIFSLPITALTQTVQDDFEGNGSISTWYGDNCNINTNLANPFQQGINTSAKVLGYGDTGGQYANVRFDISNNFDLSSDHIFSLKIYISSSELTGSQTNQVSLKLQDGTLGQPWSTQSEIIKPVALDQWQSVTFDFENDLYINLDNTSLPPIQRGDFNRVVIQVNGENNTDHVLAFIDDVYYNGYIPVDPVFDYLVWSDEFDGHGAIDTTKWFHQTQLPVPGGWYNGEIQHYTDRTANTFIDNGQLSIVVKKETFTDQGITKAYTSARLNSKFSFTYGRVEIRAKLPFGAGTWPALWMLGKNINENGAYWDNQGYGTSSWPACGEIDIMEHWGNNQNYVQSAIHTPSSFGGTINLGGQTVSTASSDFHVYSFEWTSHKLVFRVDSVIHYTYDPPFKDENTWPFDTDQYLLLNIAIQESIDPGFIQGAMEVDYVRVYQESPVSAAKPYPKSTQIYFPNPVGDKLNINVENANDQRVSLKIYNLDGKLIRTFMETVNNNTISIDLPGELFSGMYMVVYTINNTNYSLRIIKS